MAKILFINLPNVEQTTRRYMCSYPSPESLMPPLELMSCAGLVRTIKGIEVKLLDCIAEKKTLNETKKVIKAYDPEYIVSLSGFECVEQDIDLARSIKDTFPEICYIWLGHYATIFAEETLTHSKADFVILGEPELNLFNLIKVLKNDKDVSNLNGIAYFKNGKFIKQGEVTRIKNPNELPIPAYDLVNDITNYYEPLLPKPYAVIQTMRGCPYSCNYCIKSYGKNLTQLSTDRIIEEIHYLKQFHGVRSIRFTDDTFTVNKQRVIEICTRIIAERLNINWVCLSRADTLDEEMVMIMKKAGCKRIYFGLESGSQRFLDIIGKGIQVEKALDTLLLCKKAKIETAGFFMSGHPEETAEDNKLTIKFAIKSKLNFICINAIQAYPGTLFYEQVKENINFSFYPYKNEWKNSSVSKEFSLHKDKLYSTFYLRPSFMLNNAFLFLKNFSKIIPMVASFFRYLIWDKKFVIGGIKGKQDL